MESTTPNGYSIGPGLMARLLLLFSKRSFQKRRPAVSDINQAIRQKHYPDPYPNGWYSVGNATSLKPGEVRKIDCLGKNLVLFRGTQSGTICVLDAHCPHYGANLAVGGQIHGDCIECPFHKWHFNTDGQLVAVPNLDKLPRIQTRRWPIRIWHDQICIYHDSQHQQHASPPYMPPTILAFQSEDMIHRGSYHTDLIHMHLIEFAENSADYQHFPNLHGNMLLPWTPWKIPYLKVQHNAYWEPDIDQPHLAYFHDRAQLQAFGKNLAWSTAKAQITFVGPGGLVYFQFTLPNLGTIVLFQSHLPVGPLTQDVNFHWFANRKMPRLLVSYVVGSWIAQWYEDVAIWENKTYRDKPYLIKGDGPTHQLRKWFKQFYATSDVSKHPERADEETRHAVRIQ